MKHKQPTVLPTLTIKRCEEIVSRKEEVLNHCKNEGWLNAEIATLFGISLNALYNCKMYDPRVKDILERARTFSEAWWTKEARDNRKNKDFQPIIWYCTMKNAFGWADKPSERKFRPEMWQGGLEEKIKIMDSLFKDGEIAAEMYSHMMKSLYYHSQINELVYVKPFLDKLELERKYKTHEISKAQFDNEMLLWEEARVAREVAVQTILTKEKIISEHTLPQQRKVKNKNNKKPLTADKVTGVITPSLGKLRKKKSPTTK